MIEQLILKNDRAFLQYHHLKNNRLINFNKVLNKEEEQVLVPYGNHVLGAMFLNYNNIIDEQLNNTFNEISKQIDGFYFGRLDIMYHSIEDFENGKNFAIVELNGAASEPTHIYDPKHSLFFAWRELSRHIRYMYEISVQNHKKGYPYLPHKIGMEQYRLHNKQSKKIVSF